MKEKTQASRDAILAFAEVAACTARRYKQWADHYTLAAEMLEESQGG